MVNNCVPAGNGFGLSSALTVHAPAISAEGLCYGCGKGFDELLRLGARVLMMSSSLIICSLDVCPVRSINCAAR